MLTGGSGRINNGKLQVPCYKVTVEHSMITAIGKLEWKDVIDVGTC